MSAQGRSTRSRIVASARHLFWYDGYHLTTVGKILADAKVNSGSFYRFFRTKESVLLAVLANNASSFVPEIVTPAFRKSPTPLAASSKFSITIATT